MQLKAGRLAFQVTLIYVIVAGCWILFSDELMKILIADPDKLIQLSIYKGWVFVLVTGGLLYQVLKRLLYQWEQEVEQRKQAETAHQESRRQLQKSEEQLRLVLQASSDGLWDHSYKSGIVYLSPHFGVITGEPAGETAGGLEFLKRLVYPQDWPVLQASIEEHLAGKSAQSTAEFRIVLRNGKEKWIWGRGQVVERAADGSPLRMVGTISDITERKQAEAALRESKERYQALFNRSLDCVFLTDFAGRFLDANPAALSLLGFQREEIHSLNFAALLSEDQLPRAFQVVAEVKANGFQREPTEYRLRRKDGTVVCVETQSSLIMREGQPYAIQGVARDITGRKQAEQKMRLQLSAMDAATNAIVITDRAGTIEWVNPSFTRLTGYTAEEAIGSNPRVLKSGQHPPGFYATLWATVATGNVWHSEMVNKRKDGTLYTEEMTITPVRAADGEVTHFVAIKLDVSERRQLEKRLVQAQKMEAVGTLAGGIAHDFNNILAVIFGYAYLLQQDTLGNPAAQENIGEVIKAASRAKDLVQQILTFSHQGEQKRQIIPLGTVIKEAMKFLRASLPAELKIEVNLGANAPAVLADPTQIYQVTINLATNALHAMEGRPGKLTVTLDAFEPGEEFIHAHPEFQPIRYARLAVADTGCGMDSEILERIFEPFFTTKPAGKGTGLGLAVVHGIVQSHAGAILVESQPGQGTVFSLYFPGEINRVNLTNAGTGAILRGHGQRILLVDDEPTLTAPMQRLLERLNYQVTSCNSPREAIELFRENPAQFSLAITDLTMPEISGLELAQELRAIRPDFPVILVSGFAIDLNPEKLSAAGIFERMEKPVSMTALADVMHRAISASGNLAS